MTDSDSRQGEILEGRACADRISAQLAVLDFSRHRSKAR